MRAFLGARFVGGGALRQTTGEGRRNGESTCLGRRLQELSEHGQSVWLDYLSRDILESGKLAEMMDRDAVVGVTSNPTIFQKALAAGDAYDDQLKGLLEHEDDPKEIFLALSADDVKGGLELLRPVFDASGGEDGYVSWEVDPEIAYDRERTFEEAKRLHEWIDEPNLYVKIPATEPGVGAIEDSVAAGRNINVTLIFSLQRHEEVMEAYVRGLERFAADGGDLSTGALCRVVLRLACRHRSRQAARAARPTPISRASSRSRTRSSRTRTTSASSPASAGTLSLQRARIRNGASGRRRRRRTLRTAT